MFTIGPFSRLAGVSAKVLRSYDRVGLFRPVWTDPSSGYRYYSPAQLPDVRRILALRDMGMGLAEIGALVEGGVDFRMALDRRRVQLEHERREIERRLATLDIRVEMSSDGQIHPDVVLRPVPAEAVALLRLDTTADPDVGRAFYELEALVRDQGRRAHRPPVHCFTRTATSRSSFRSRTRSGRTSESRPAGSPPAGLQRSSSEVHTTA